MNPFVPMSAMLRTVPHWLRAGRLTRLLRDRQGAAAITLAVTLSGIAGVAGLGTEVAAWYFKQRTMQAAADSAASTAAAALAAGLTDQTNLTTEARSIAASSNFVNGSGSTVDVSFPTSCGSFTSNCIQVNISQPQTPGLSALFMASGPTIAARAVAHANPNISDSGCVLALGKTPPDGIGLDASGSPVMSFTGCAMYDNATGASALTIGGSASISAAAAYISGGISGSTANLTTTDGTFTGTNPIADPYAGVTVPTKSSCDQNNDLHNPSNLTLTPPSGGIYKFCGDVRLDATGSSLTLNPGIYIIDGGHNLTMTGGTINATGGVTIVLENSGGGNPGVVNTNGNATINITAPTSGPTAGIALMQSRVTCTGNGSNATCPSTITGGGTQNITGAIYFPNNKVTYGGNSATGGAQCTQIVAYQIAFSGNSYFRNTCTGTGAQNISISGGQLVL